MTFSEAVTEAIRLADAIQTYWETELPKRHRDYPFVHPGEDSGPPPPEEQRLRGFLASMPEYWVYKLLLIMDAGRREVTADDLEAHFKSLKASFPNRDAAELRMAEEASLADELADGVDELNRNGIDLDHLIPAPVA